jgi:oxygen-independent coproporphyrinogen III oxidase
MSGIYIHIPFCKKACYYCDFHFSTSLKNKDQLIDAILQEIELRRLELAAEKNAIGSIYLGGGTPSLLSQKELFALLNQVARYFKIKTSAEITLEANPDDITLQNLKEWKQAGINRLSIGVQSFKQEHLTYMNRAHSNFQAINSILQSQEAGFNNLSIDLIYGFPGLSDEQWVSNINTAIQLQVPHISAYCMTVEDRTALKAFIGKGKAAPMDEIQATRQFENLMECMAQHAYEQYEISNFAKNQLYSQHNSNYWKGEHYLGFGPSAHSFNGTSRKWNISNNPVYIKKMEEKTAPSTLEILSKNQQYNEYILTSLRTNWGTSIEKISAVFGEKLLAYFNTEAKLYVDSGDLIISNAHYYLSQKGKFFADKIASDLFFVD